jgi:hypothetical protein
VLSSGVLQAKLTLQMHSQLCSFIALLPGAKRQERSQSIEQAALSPLHKAVMFRIQTVDPLAQGVKIHECSSAATQQILEAVSVRWTLDIAGINP